MVQEMTEEMCMTVVLSSHNTAWSNDLKVWLGNLAGDD